MGAGKVVLYPTPRSPKSTEVIPETIIISADCLGDATKGMDQIGNSRDQDIPTL